MHLPQPPSYIHFPLAPLCEQLRAIMTASHASHFRIRRKAWDGLKLSTAFASAGRLSGTRWKGWVRSFFLQCTETGEGGVLIETDSEMDAILVSGAPAEATRQVTQDGWCCNFLYTVDRSRVQSTVQC